MELSEDQKQKIEAEERYGAEIKQELAHKPMQQKKSKRSGCFWVFAIFLALFGFGVIASAMSQPKQINEAQVSQSEAGINTTNRVSGIGVGRKIVMSSLREDGFVFQKVDNIDGQESYMAINKAATVMLTGPADNLVQVGITVKLGDSNTSSTVLSQTYILSLASTIAPESVKWIAEDTVAHKDVSQPYKSSKVFGGNKFLLSYQPKMFMALFISPE